jgi:hypothetical protein
MSGSNDDREFRERFDLAVTAILLAIVALGSSVWIEATIRGLYY